MIKLLKFINEIFVEIVKDEEKCKFISKGAKAFNQSFKEVLFNNHCKITRATMSKYNLELSECYEWEKQKLLKKIESTSWKSKQLGNDLVFYPTTKLFKLI